MIDYEKRYQLKRNTYVLLLRMNQDGWKLVALPTGGTTGIPQYLMSKEILLDDAAINLYLQNLKSLKNVREDLSYQ
jgi:hypothetical protein